MRTRRFRLMLAWTAAELVLACGGGGDPIDSMQPATPSDAGGGGTSGAAPDGAAAGKASIDALGGTTASGGSAVSVAGGPEAAAGSAGATTTSGGSAPTSAGAAGAAGSSGVPEPTEAGPIGWASVNAMGLDGTHGGAGGKVVVASTLEQFKGYAASKDPLVIQVAGHLVGSVDVTSNKTIEGRAGAVFEGHLGFRGVADVIVRNLTIKGYNCTEDKGTCRQGEDAVTVYGSHHLWFDHLDVSDGTDGNLDITQGSDYVTVSWTKFWYSTPGRAHAFSNLVGGADNNAKDVGHLKVTFHHDWWADNVNERMPRTRYGEIHVFNNLYSAHGNAYCISAGMDAKLLVQNNVFKNVNDPHDVNGGELVASGNLYPGSTGAKGVAGKAFEPPYTFKLDAAEAVESLVTKQAGPH